jgi:signal transduction histidine kinase
VIESTGRESLREMRRLLGVLREGAEDGERAPAPCIADLDELVRQVGRAGTSVELSAYRIVQEALTNVVKHAGTGRCRVLLDYARDALAIEVTDDGVGAAAGTGTAAEAPSGPVAAPRGHGLLGMGERAALHGGRFEAGPLPLRGFRVAASLPLEEAAT